MFRRAMFEIWDDEVESVEVMVPIDTDEAMKTGGLHLLSMRKTLFCTRDEAIALFGLERVSAHLREVEQRVKAAREEG